MDYCLSHFGKSINDLKIEDIETFFRDERVETDQLEFKSINPNGNINEKFAGINKSICAFLNSSGGLLIWGAPEGKKVEGKKEKVFVGDLTFFHEVIEKDFTVSKISDSIIPLPSDIRVKILQKDNTSLAIIEIDTSEYSPHQTADTYFMRIDGQSKPAPHHYIEALFKKIKYPNIEAFFKIIKAELFQNKYKIDFELYFFNWSPLINEEKLSFRLITESGKFEGAKYPDTSHFYRLYGSEFYKDNAKNIFYFGEPVREANTVFFDIVQLAKKEFIATIFISFGGKFSPMKSSIYKLNFKDLHNKKPSEIIVEKTENRLTKDIQDEKGVNKSSLIKDLMEYKS